MTLLAFGMPGPFELCIIGLVGVLLFGHQLPKIARSLGSAIPSFKKGLSEVEGELDGIKKTLES
jgi:TatA/E family protein of Tat protein translocase